MSRGRDLAMERKAAGLRQEQLARELGLNQGTVIDIERERVVPTSPTIEQLIETVRSLAARRDGAPAAA